MADWHDVMSHEHDANEALGRAYTTTASQNLNEADSSIVYGLIAIGRCILAVGVRLDYALSRMTREP